MGQHFVLILNCNGTWHIFKHLIAEVYEGRNFKNIFLGKLIQVNFFKTFEKLRFLLNKLKIVSFDLLYTVRILSDIISRRWSEGQNQALTFHLPVVVNVGVSQIMLFAASYWLWLLTTCWVKFPKSLKEIEESIPLGDAAFRFPDCSSKLGLHWTSAHDGWVNLWMNRGKINHKASHLCCFSGTRKHVFCRL